MWIHHCRKWESKCNKEDMLEKLLLWGYGSWIHSDIDLSGYMIFFKNK